MAEYVISSGVTSNGINLKQDTMTVLLGGTVNSTFMSGTQAKLTLSGGIANKTTIVDYGDILVSNNGLANSTIMSGGKLTISAGGTANATTLVRGSVNVLSGTADNTIVSGGKIEVGSGIANSTTIYSGGEMVLGAAMNYTNAQANDTTVNSGGSLRIFSGGTANRTVINSGGRVECLRNPILLNETTINSGGYLSLYGTATDIFIEKDGRLGVSKGAVVSNIVASSIYELSVDINSSTYVKGNYAGSAFEIKDGKVSSFTLSSRGRFVISSEGTANKLILESSAVMSICSAGIAINTTVCENASVYVFSGGVATQIVENGGFVEYEDDTIVDFASNSFSGLNLFDEKATVHSGTTANSITINSNGTTTVFSGGIVNSAKINNCGTLFVSSGGLVKNITARAGSILKISSGGILTGTLVFEQGSLFTIEKEAIIDFDLTLARTKTNALLTDWSLVQGTPNYTITVSADQKTGLYKLAGYADEFDDTITVNNVSGTKLGTLKVGEAFVVNENTYTLLLENENLILSIVGSTPLPPVGPEKPVATADITTPTNGDVLVTATFSEDSVLKEYSLDGENWGVYAGGVLFSSNRTAYFRGIDAEGNISEIAEYEVTNIDRTAPNKPVVSVDVTTPTNRSVTVSADFDEDSSTKEYSFDGEKWLKYTDAILCSKNETVSFRGIDEAGNVSEVASLAVTNIDSSTPTDPFGLQAIVSNQTVALLWNVSTDDSSGIKEYLVSYSLDGQEFTVRTANSNYVLNNADFGTYSWSVQAVDFAGNESAIVAGDAFTISGFKPYTVEYSADNFEHVIRFTVSSPTLDSFRMPTGTYQLRVRQEGNSEWMTGDSIVAAEFDSTPQLIKSDADGNADVFFANSVGTWESCYVAQHVGSINDWTGTNEFASVFGKNKLADIIEGSTDANILLMTDDDNGDALFVDDIYSDSPDELGLIQARIAQIDEIRAGFGDDIVDMTSQRFEYTGDGLTIRGGAGNDTIWANKGDNKLFGDAGNDRIVGASGNDIIAGGIGNDRLHGGGGNDVFTFCDNWGVDNVEQLATGSVTLWFASGDESNWNAETLTYTDGENSVKVSGVTADKVTLKFGDDGSAQFASLANMGAFFDATSERIFEESGKGMLASL